MNARVHAATLTDVSTILATPNDPLLPTRVNLFVIVDVWHHVEDQPGVLVHFDTM